MTELLSCPFCGSGWLYETRRNDYRDETPAMFCNSCKAVVTWEQVEEEGVNDETKTFVREHWNTRAAMEFDNWFYMPKPKEPIVEVTETTHAWDGTKVKTDVFYQVQEQAVINWAKELDEHIIKRICEVWNTRAELGSGTLTAEQVREAIFDGSAYASYDGAKYYADGINMQAVADELNNRAERTCKNLDNDADCFFCCSVCGSSSVTEFLGSGEGVPHFCPNCGAKVVE